MYNPSTCTFTWSQYFAKNIGSRNVLVAYRSDKASLIGSFLSQNKGIFIANISLTGTLIRLKYLVESVFSFLNDIIYDQTNDAIFIAYSGTNYKVLSMQNMGDTTTLTPTFLTASANTGGDPYSIVNQDSTYMWVVGRMTDSFSNEKAFHHARINKADGTCTLAIYMDAVAALGIFHLSHSDYSVPS